MTRDLRISNMKGFLIFFVVFGHLVELYKVEFKPLYLLIYTFHMPLFILISGYLAKHASMKKVINFLFIYLMFQPVYRCFFFLFNREKPFELKMDVPYFQLWYLISMAVWYLLAIGINNFRLLKWQKVIFACLFFGIGLVARYYTGPFVDRMESFFPAFYSYTLSYQRTITFFPFFFVGLSLTEDTMKKLQKSLKLKWLAAVVTFGSLYLFYIRMDGKNFEKILKGSYGIDELKGSVFTISWQLILSYLLALIMCYLLLNLISEKQSFLTRLGDHSLPIYLFHAFFITILKKMKFLGACPAVFLLILFFVLAIFIVWLLSTQTFIKLTNGLCNPVRAISNMVKRDISLPSRAKE